MVSTDASGKGSRIYGKTSDNILALELAAAQGLLDSAQVAPAWAAPMLAAAETAARSGRDAFIARTPHLNRRFTGYDIERACPPDGTLQWWRLLLGAEGTLGLVTRIRVKLRRIEFQSGCLWSHSTRCEMRWLRPCPCCKVDPTGVEVMDETVQNIASSAGISIVYRNPTVA